jgi:hypothetical protein
MTSMTMTPDNGESAMSKYYAKKLSDLTTVSLCRMGLPLLDSLVLMSDVIALHCTMIVYHWLT